jgi:hypothetical protein
MLVGSGHFGWDADCEVWEERLRTQHDLALEFPGSAAVSEIVYELVDGKLIPRNTSEYSPRGARDGIPPPETECGDVVLYGRDPAHLDRVKYQLEKYPTDQGELIRTRCFVGSEDPLDARWALNATLGGNYNWNDYWHQQGIDKHVYPFAPPGPPLYIVGTADLVHHMTYDDDIHETCMMPVCYSDQDIAYFDDWGTYWSVVRRLPIETLDDAASECMNADAWNAHWAADPEDKAVFFCGDLLDGNDESLVDDMQVIADIYEGLDRPAIVYAESDYDGFYARRDAGIEAFLGLFSELWIMGYQTAAHWYTDFLTENWREWLPCMPPFFIHAPSCNTCGKGISYHTALHEYLLNYNGLAGVIGQLNADWGFRHEFMRDRWRDIYFNAEPGTSFDQLLWDFLEVVRERHPRYARGVALHGAYLVVPPLDLARVQEEQGHDFQITRRTTRTGMVLDFTLPEDALVSITIYDVQGRLIRSCADRAEYPSGSHSLLWDLSNDTGLRVPAGVYFVRFRASSAAEAYQRDLKAVVLGTP